MFEGELESLKAIRNTNTLSVPRPQRVLPHPSGQGAVLVVEYVDMRGLHKYQSQLGEQLARWTHVVFTLCTCSVTSCFTNIYPSKNLIHLTLLCDSTSLSCAQCTMIVQQLVYLTRNTLGQVDQVLLYNSK